MDTKKIANVIRQHRDYLRMTQDEYGAMFGLTGGAVCRWETEDDGQRTYPRQKVVDAIMSRLAKDMPDRYEELTGEPITEVPSGYDASKPCQFDAEIRNACVLLSLLGQEARARVISVIVSETAKAMQAKASSQQQAQAQPPK